MRDERARVYAACERCPLGDEADTTVDAELLDVMAQGRTVVIGASDNRKLRGLAPDSASAGMLPSIAPLRAHTPTAARLPISETSLHFVCSIR